MRLLITIALATLVGCSPKTQSVSGVEMAVVKSVHTDTEGRTVEQQNLIERIKRDNEPGALKHLYIISAYSGQVILYSPVKGKVTSTGKRLTPRKVTGSGTRLEVGGQTQYVDELPGEDGTFGSSSDAIFWFTPDGRYHQEMINGGVIVHIADHPIVTKGVIITIESK